MSEYKYFKDDYSGHKWKIHKQLVPEIEALCLKQGIKLIPQTFQETKYRWHFIIKTKEDINKYWIRVHI